MCADLTSNLGRNAIIFGWPYLYAYICLWFTLSMALLIGEQSMTEEYTMIFNG